MKIRTTTRRTCQQGQRHGYQTQPSHLPATHISQADLPSQIILVENSLASIFYQRIPAILRCCSVSMWIIAFGVEILISFSHILNHGKHYLAKLFRLRPAASLNMKKAGFRFRKRKWLKSIWMTTELKSSLNLWTRNVTVGFYLE